MTTRSADIEVALRKRWPAEAFALIFQVPNGTGSHKSRTADALVFGLWPSRGLDIEGVEIKVSRSDWRKEIEDPTKAATFSKHCHRWWIAAPPGVVESGELPPQWGLLELKRGVLRQTVEAPRTEPEPIPHRMWCAVMRSVQNNELAAVNAERRALEQAAEAKALQKYEDRLTSLNSAIEEFKDVTGIDVRYSKYRLDELKRALEFIAEGRTHENVLRSLAYLPDRLRGLADEIHAATQAAGGET